MRRRALRSLLFALAVGLTAGPISAQVPTQDLSESESALRVFLDCATWRCREDRFRQDISWVDWVREPQDAQVYIIMTGQGAGSGGFQYVFDFEGRGALADLVDRYLYTSSGTDVEEEVVAGLTRTLSLGLVRFMAAAGFSDLITVTGAEVAQLTERELQEEEDDDPWNYWVFSLGGSAELEREDRETRDQFRFNVSANRTTDLWKIDLGGYFNYNRREVEFDNGGSFVDERDDWGARGLVVRSLSSHWSVGVLMNTGSSTRFNRDFALEISPAVEWNYFPWQESTRRRFVVLYTLGAEYVDYEEITIFQQTEETLVQQRLDVAFRQQESWGNASIGAEARQYLNHTDEYSLDFRGNVDYRLVRGLGLRFQVEYEVIRDQRFLSGEGLTPEEILISRRALGTGSRFSFEMGISYRFGSIFNTVVNSRFPSFRSFR